MKLVVDASAALPWFFADEKSDESDRVLAEIYRDGAVVPVLWPIEVGNALTMGLRRKRLSEADWLKSLYRCPIAHERRAAGASEGIIEFAVSGPETQYHVL